MVLFGEFLVFFLVKREFWVVHIGGKIKSWENIFVAPNVILLLGVCERLCHPLRK